MRLIRMKEMREELGMSQRELSETAHVSLNTVYKLEAHESKPYARRCRGFEQAIKIADALKTDVYTLIGRYNGQTNNAVLKIKNKKLERKLDRIQNILEE